MAVPRSDQRQSPRAPATWVRRFAGLVPADGTVLDVAAGAGRHARYFLSRGHRVVAVDRDISALADLASEPRIEILEADLETGPWPLAGRRFAAVVVTNYLWRPLFQALIESLDTGGLLVYQTFARGNERLGKPRNPDHLLESGELLEAVRGKLAVVAYEHGVVERPRPAVVQRICAVKAAADVAAGVMLPLPPAAD